MPKQPSKADWMFTDWPEQSPFREMQLLKTGWLRVMVVPTFKLMRQLLRGPRRG